MRIQPAVITPNDVGNRFVYVVQKCRYCYDSVSKQRDQTHLGSTYF